MKKCKCGVKIGEKKELCLSCNTIKNLIKIGSKYLNKDENYLKRILNRTYKEIYEI